ncbi:MAG: SelL-related redox protein [Planctomycetia bacterium]
MSKTRWMTVALLLAAAYNLLWGTLVVLAPQMTLSWIGLAADHPARTAPQFWQCIGMIVGVYGIGYGLAAFDPLRHWPIVLVGFLGKIFGPIGFVVGYLNGELPLQMAWTNLTNDVIWWAPFGLILAAAFRNEIETQARREAEVLTVAEAAAASHTQTGVSLVDLSRERPALVVFLRHAGCTYCREALADLAERRAAIEAGGATVVLVHMTDEPFAAAFFKNYGLDDLPRISDPTCRLYRAFGLKRGTWKSFVGGPSLGRAYEAFVKGGHGVGLMAGDGLRMPGVFLFQDGRIVREFRHEYAGDRPDYLDLSTCPLPTAQQ